MLSRGEVRAYWRETRRVSHFLRLLQVRLSLSKIGPLVCPKPMTADVELRSFGGPVRLRSHTTDISVLGELILGGSYDALVEAIVDEPQVILDLGANTGLTARWFLNRYPAARLVSVEPERGNLEVLERNLSRFADRARVMAVAVGGRPRRAVLAGGSGEFGFKIGEPNPPVPAGETDVVTMDVVLKGLGATVDVLKCDIEGAEGELFDSCSSWLPQVRLASVECHHPFTSERLLESIRRNNVEVEVLDSESRPEFGCDSILLRVRS